MTNIALAFRIEPELPRKVGRVIIMGGAFFLTPYGYGNASAVSEFSFYVDPEAASIVLQPGVKPLCVEPDATTNPEATLESQ